MLTWLTCHRHPRSNIKWHMSKIDKSPEQYKKGFLGNFIKKIRIWYKNYTHTRRGVICLWMNTFYSVLVGWSGSVTLLLEPALGFFCAELSECLFYIIQMLFPLKLLSIPLSPSTIASGAPWMKRHSSCFCRYMRVLLVTSDICSIQLSKKGLRPQKNPKRVN